ncbi:uncharacterized protein LY89DRAFT_720451 [Mollisia scopiformis]|uniref:Uncharacterized protein n=1 Tax=Mollisia scopiformis TaxID=149040 RepID=A0A194X4D8_MOLSC|nr:uncharacterized protein LY89DRAFT_720451 [Mollisia scopiformis]KUJ15045.1 hypothetical protein LY89DRAFT_720451 [Mollisia scopiformis]
MSALGPIDPSSVQNEEQKEAPWIVRKLAGSMTGRVVISSYESLRATGTSVVCLSPWGDSTPLVLPCIRFRDLAIHAVVAATGGTAAIAAPVMGPISDVVVGSLGDTILVELGLHAGFEAAVWAGDEILIDKPMKKIIPVHSANLTTSGVKILTITLKYKHSVEDAALGFFRSSTHADPSLFASVSGYLAVEKGWFSPYLFASARRPIIPRTMKPDVVFCHGPFLSGDYSVGETLVAQSAKVLHLCQAPPTTESTASSAPQQTPSMSFKDKLNVSKMNEKLNDKFTTLIHRTKSHPSSDIPASDPQSLFPDSPDSPPPTLQATVPPPRQLAVILLGLEPHRLGMWTSSARPSESVLQYILLNGAPTIILPALAGAPLIAWNTLTLRQIQAKRDKYDGIVRILFEYISLCVDWARVTVGEGVEDREKAVRDALELVVASAAQSFDSKRVKKDVDLDRAGIVIFRIL